MPTGAVPLLEAANGTETVLKQGFVNTILRNSALSDMIPWMTIQSDSIRHQEEVDLPNPAYRSVNEGYTASWGRDTEYYWGVTILGGEVTLDNFLVNVMGNVVNQKANQFSLQMTPSSRTCFPVSAVDTFSISSIPVSINRKMASDNRRARTPARPSVFRNDLVVLVPLERAGVLPRHLGHDRFPVQGAFHAEDHAWKIESLLDRPSRRWRPRRGRWS